MASLSCSSDTGILTGEESRDSLRSLADDKDNSIDLPKVDKCRQKLTRSLFVDQILEVSLSKEGRRIYRVQWESTWESEDDLINVCKDILCSYWNNQLQFNIIVDKDVYPDESNSRNDEDDFSISADENRNENALVKSSRSSQVTNDILRLSNSEDAHMNDNSKSLANDIPEPYKNIGFAKSVRENFGKGLPSENKFDFVEHYLSEKLMVKNRPVDKKRAREELIRHYVSYKNGTRVDCDICWESFADQKSLLRHQVCRHDKFSPHQCSICLKKFMKPGDVRRHMTSHSLARTHYCFFCEKTYKTKNHLHRHIKTKHGNLDMNENNGIEQMMTADQNDIGPDVMNLANNPADSNALSTEPLHNEYNNPEDNVNPVNLASSVLYQDTSVLQNASIVLHNQVDLTENFMNSAAEGMQICLLDRGFF